MATGGCSTSSAGRGEEATISVSRSFPSLRERVRREKGAHRFLTWPQVSAGWPELTARRRGRAA